MPKSYGFTVSNFKITLKLCSFIKVQKEKQAHLLALWTHKRGLVLSLEHVDNEGVVSLFVDGPGKVGHLVVWLAVPLHRLGVWLLTDTVHIL